MFSNLKKFIKSILRIQFLYNFFAFLYNVVYDYLYLNFFGFILRIFPIKNNKIVVCSYYGMDYGDNPKPIVEKLLNIDKNKKLDIVWILNSDFYDCNSLPDRVRKVKYESIACLYELVTAKIWIDNSRKKFVPPKRKKQFYIQTWHGGLCLKKIEKDAEDVLPKLYIKRAIKDSKYSDLFVSNSKWESMLYHNSFWYDGEILEVGLPRNDILINSSLHDNICKKVHNELNVSLDKRILLYAPTFRKSYNLDCYNIDYLNLKKELEEKTGKEWVILVRLHPNISIKSEELSLPSNVIDVSAYPDLYNLMIATNLLITDYSSLMFDFGYLRRPVVLFATDIDSYLNDRGFMFDFKELPFIFTKNNRELIQSIKKYNEANYQKNLNNFYNSVGLNETGNSSTKIANLIIKECGINEEK